MSTTTSHIETNNENDKWFYDESDHNIEYLNWLAPSPNEIKIKMSCSEHRKISNIIRRHIDEHHNSKLQFEYMLFHIYQNGAITTGGDLIFRNRSLYSHYESLPNNRYVRSTSLGYSFNGDIFPLYDKCNKISYAIMKLHDALFLRDMMIRFIRDKIRNINNIDKTQEVLDTNSCNIPSTVQNQMMSVNYVVYGC